MRRRRMWWFYRPCWYLPGRGWRRWLPFGLGDDELCRRTLVLGHSVTGRVVIALWWHVRCDCGPGGMMTEEVADG